MHRCSQVPAATSALHVCPYAGVLLVRLHMHWTAPCRFQTGSQEGAMSMEAAFSPDSQYVLS
eukprot:1005938-Pelagomonas_calceolata.AAC.2